MQFRKNWMAIELWVTDTSAYLSVHALDDSESNEQPNSDFFLFFDILCRKHVSELVGLSFLGAYNSVNIRIYGEKKEKKKGKHFKLIVAILARFWKKNCIIASLFWHILLVLVIKQPRSLLRSLMIKIFEWTFKEAQAPNKNINFNIPSTCFSIPWKLKYHYFQFIIMPSNSNSSTAG